MKKILVINPFGIGDVLFTTPVIQAVKEAYPDAYLGYWCNQRVSALLKNDPRINRIFALSRGDLKKLYHHSPMEAARKFFGLLSGIRKERFEVALDFSLDHRYSLACKILGIKKRVGFNYKKRGRFLTQKIDIDSYKDRHVVEYYLELLKFINIKAKSNKLYLFVPEADKNKARAKLRRLGVKEGDLVVGIAPGAGASWGKYASIKHWPPLKYARLAEVLSSGLRTKILILGDDSERSISDIIVSAMKNKPIDLTGKTGLEDLAALVSQLNILITNDGGPLHIAVALAKKTVSIFGPVDERVYGPYPPGPDHIVIKKELPCRPCYNSFRFQGCLSNRECIDDISVEDVLNRVKELL
ncbi:glycosyltransferase family 9 protein [bacterium]|nr:MAG: glycosyltransferase family 9 protein [bacterium]